MPNDEANSGIMSQEQVLLEAEFNDAVTTYWLMGGMIVCVVSVVGILFLPVWYFFGKWLTRKQSTSVTCRCIPMARALRESISD